MMRRLCALAVGLSLLVSHDSPPALAVDATICRHVSQLPDDCGSAVQRKFDNLRDQRYAEIDLFAKDAFRNGFYEAAYNTTGLNGGAESGDSAPESIVQTLNIKALAKQYQALVVQLSPPRYWTIDGLSDRVGAVRSFGGLNAAWMGDRPASMASVSSKPVSKAYRAMVIPQTAIEAFKKGSKVYLLDDSSDRTWVMRYYTDKALDKLDRLGELIVFPSGWKFRTVLLSKDLILEPKTGVGAVTTDDMEDEYALTGPGHSNFRP